MGPVSYTHLDVYKRQLRAIGLDKLALEWIGGKTLSPYSIAFVYFWQQAGYIAVSYTHLFLFQLVQNYQSER